MALIFIQSPMPGNLVFVGAYSENIILNVNKVLARKMSHHSIVFNSEKLEPI